MHLSVRGAQRHQSGIYKRGLALEVEHVAGPIDGLEHVESVPIDRVARVGARATVAPSQTRWDLQMLMVS